MTGRSAQDYQGSKESHLGRRVPAMHSIGNIDQFFDDFWSNKWLHPSKQSWPIFSGSIDIPENLPKVDIVDRDNEKNNRHTAKIR